MEAKKERTLILIKPDGVQRGLIGEIIKRYERSGLKLIALKFLVPDVDTTARHYQIDPNWLKDVGEKSIGAYKEKGLTSPSEDPIEIGKTILERLKRYLSTGPVVVMIWQGTHAVGVVRKITGGTEPLTSDVGTIRGDLTLDSYEVADAGDRAVRNLIHASATPEEAEKEIAIWFSEDEIVKYNLVQEKILYDVNIDGILE